MMHKDRVLILAIVGTLVIGFVVIAYGWRAADVAAECELKCKPRQSRLVRDSERLPSSAGEAPLMCQCYDK
jgi:hypothetical protein